MMNYLAIDAGTSSIKMGIFAQTGELLKSVDCQTTLVNISEGISEMCMIKLWDDVQQLFRELHRNCPAEYSQVKKISICAQGEGLWALDKSGKPIRNAILWNDTRPLTYELDWGTIHSETTRRDTNKLYSGSFPYQLRWLKENEPNNYHKIEHIFHCKDWLNYCLTGQIATDQSDASTAVFNLQKQTYLPELLDLFGVSDKSHALSKIVPSGELVGRITESVAKELSLPEDVDVIMGALDLVAVSFGAGLTEPGQRLSILGTTLANIQVFSESDRPQANEGSVICHVQPGTFIRQVSALSGTINLRWLKEWTDSSYSEMEDVVLKEKTNLLFLPYLMGERAPFHSLRARGVFHGLTPQTSKQEMIRAVYEGVLFSMKDCWSYLSPSVLPINVTGGGFQSKVIAQLAADIMGVEIQQINEPQLGLLGLVKLMISDDSNLGYVKYIPQENYDEKYREFIRLKEALINYWNHEGINQSTPE